MPKLLSRHQLSLLPIRWNNGVGRTWAICHAMLLGGTDEEIFDLAATLYIRETNLRGMPSPGSHEDVMANFKAYGPVRKHYAPVVQREGLETSQDELGRWSVSVSRYYPL